MNFLQYGIWGAYLISMGAYLSRVGLGPKIGLFYAIQGIVSIFMPAIAGMVADKFLPAQKVLSICHGFAGAFMIASGLYCVASHDVVAFAPLFTLYSLSVAFYMPTIALSNSVAYSALEQAGMDTVKSFPPIRVFGTIGFIVSMLFVNFASSDGVQFQNSCNQFFTAGVLGIVLAAYALTMPNVPVNRSKSQSFAQAIGLDSLKILKDPQTAVFFIFCMLLGASLQITNGYGNSYISSFQSSPIPELANSWGARNANALISISQISETCCILLIPFFYKKFGIKTVMMISMIAWVLRFGLFGAGNPGSGVWMFVLSCIVYGVAFDFFNISGSLHVNENTPSEMRSSAQGLFMLMTNGLGATIGTLSAQAVVNHFVFNAENPDWSMAWYIFAGYALIVAVLFMILYRNPARQNKRRKVPDID